MAAGHIASLQAIKAALTPIYASYSDEQNPLAEGLKIGPMDVMWPVWVRWDHRFCSTHAGRDFQYT